MPLVIRLIVFAIVLSACLAPVVLALRRAGSRPRVRGPRCGRCGYIVRGLESRVCPECGSKLYPDGIVYPSPRRWLAAGPRAKRIAWTALLVWLGWFFTGPGAAVPDLIVGPGIAIEKTEIDYLWLEEPQVGTRAIRAAVVLRDLAPKLTPREFVVGTWPEAVPSWPREGLHLDLENGRYEVRDPSGRVTESAAAITPAALGNWLRAHHRANDDEHVQALLTLATKLRTYRGVYDLAWKRTPTPIGTLHVTGGIHFADRQPVWSQERLTWGVLFVLWCGGLLLLRRDKSRPPVTPADGSNGNMIECRSGASVGRALPATGAAGSARPT